MTQRDLRTQTLFGLEFLSESTLDEVVDRVIALAREPHPTKDPFVITPNVDYLVQFNKPELRPIGDQFIQSALILPDGMPIIWASKALRKPLRARLTGSDMFPILWRKLCADDLKVMIVVAQQEIADRLKQEMPNVVSYQPPFYALSNSSATAQVHEALLKLVQEHRPHLIVMGIAAPKQQLMTLHLKSNLPREHLPLTLMIGASMEFYLGMRQRAPEWMRRSGLEWLHRLSSEPRRMFKRYIIDGMRFFPLILNERRKQVKEQRGA